MNPNRGKFSKETQNESAYLRKKQSRKERLNTAQMSVWVEANRSYGTIVRFDGFFVVLTFHSPSNLFAPPPSPPRAANKLEGKWKVRTIKNHQNRKAI